MKRGKVLVNTIHNTAGEGSVHNMPFQLYTVRGKLSDKTKVEGVSPQL